MSRLALIFLLAINISAQQSPSPLQIVVIAGEDSINVIQQKTAVAPVVEVRDRNNLPVAGASVSFTIAGQSAAFPGGVQTIALTTNAAGRAAVSALTPLTSGPLQIQVTAVFQGQTAAAVITQTNVMTAAQAAAAGAATTGTSTSTTAAGGTAGSGGGISGQTLGIIGGVAGAATAGALVSGQGDAPPQISMTQSPDGQGIAGVTEFSFSISGGAATAAYDWNFGDGATGTGSQVTHRFESAGTFQVVAHSATDGTASLSVTVGTLAGAWRSLNDGPIYTNAITMTQQGSNVGGQWRIDTAPNCVNPGCVPGTTVFQITGTLSSPRLITFSYAQECARTFTGQVSADLRTLVGVTMSANPNCVAIEGPQNAFSWGRP